MGKCLCIQFQVTAFAHLHFVEVLVDLTDSAPPQKKVWPEEADAVDAAPPADAKKKDKADKEAERKKFLVSNIRHPFYQIEFTYHKTTMHPAGTVLRNFMHAVSPQS